MDILHPAKRLDELTKEIHACILEGTRRFLMIGKLLKQVQDDQLWALSGCDVLTFLESIITKETVEARHTNQNYLGIY